jgi:hypothetical protein
VNQAELESRLAAIAPGGDPSKLQFVESTEKRKVTKQTSQYAPPTEVEVSVPVRLWYDPATGRALKVDVNEDGTYAKTYDGIDNTLRKESTTPAETPASRRTAREEAEIARNASLPPDQDPRAETDAERATRSDTRIKQQGADAERAQKEADTTVVSVAYQGTGKNRKKVTTYKSGRTASEDAPTNATAIGVTYDADGTKVTKYDDGTETREQKDPATVAPKDVAVTKQGSDGKTYVQHTVSTPGKPDDVYYTAPGSTERVQFPDDTSKTAGTNLPESLQGWRPDSTKPGWGLFERADQLSKAAAQGLIKPQDVPVILAREQALTESAAAQHVNEQRAAESARTASQTQRGQDLATQTSLRSNVGSMFSTAQAGAAPFLGKVAPPAGGSITGGLVRSQMALGQAMGAYDTPDIEIPNFARPYAQASQAAAQSVPAAADLNDPTNAAWVRHDPLNSAPAAAAAPPALTPPPMAPVFGPPPAVPGSATVAAPGPTLPTGAYSGPTGWDFQPGAPQMPEASGQTPEMPAFANSMLSPRARLEALGYPPEVIEEALAHARAQGMAA